jgi:hypothetical protein
MRGFPRGVSITVGPVENEPMKAVGNPLPGPASNSHAERVQPMMPLRDFG